jgi:hypothetical protein
MKVKQRRGWLVGPRWRRLIAVTPLAAAAAGVLLAGVLGSVQPLYAALQVGDSDPDVLLGADDDTVNNPAVQPPGTVANQSLNNTDV